VRRISQDEWDRRGAAVDIEWLQPLENGRVKTPARCTRCGYGDDGACGVRGESVAAGTGCPRCAGMILTQEDWDQRAAKVDIEWLEPVRNDSTKTRARCLNCGREWSASPHHVRRSQRCAQCAGKIVTQDDWDRRGAVVGLEWLAPVAGSAVKTPARCLTCGHEWSPVPSQAQQGAGCPRCAGQIVTHEEWDLRAASVGIEWLDPVVNILTTSRARCRTCGHVWPTWPGNVSRGHGCPVCAGQIVTQGDWNRPASTAAPAAGAARAGS